jgi:flagellar motility protein MotE (MotC chaperone)
VNKKRIIMMAVAGVVSFSAALGVSIFLGKGSAGTGDVNTPPEAGSAASASGEGLFPLPQQRPAASEDKKVFIEKQLSGMVYDVREKMRQYETKLEELQQQEDRMKVAEDTLKKDVEQLDNLRVELSTKVASLKDEREKLLASRVKVSQTEKANLVSVAGTYDKMDAASASKIMINMSKMTEQGQAGNGLEEAVKILYYMTDRTKAKVLAEMVTTEPKLAALVSGRLKKITEE